ncbi:DUF5602 domain-containing protein [Lolliginicoccus levis]|uniref:DUF5602 domain-containing protein n=1 Tax=Lolliginicoccus levis TaxID=2919542 RepID=UPI00241C28AD|nr:DUF5602 domain-containing protein [Lolliginicoccus levis]
MTTTVLRGRSLAASAITLAVLAAGCGSDDTEPSAGGTTTGGSETTTTAPSDTTTAADEQPGANLERGPVVTVGEGEASAFVTVDAEDNPREVGIRITEDALEGLPDDPDAPPTVWTLELPESAGSTMFNHVSLDWASGGHEPPGLFDKPHFDMHFFMIDETDVAEIMPTDPEFTAKAANLPDEPYMPEGYVVPPEPPIEMQGVPNMGVHWLDSADELVPGEYVFESTLIMGSWDGEFIFVEPMITREWLLGKPSLEQDIPQPEAFTRDGYFPTTYSVEFDEETSEYVITLGGLEERSSE